MFDSKGNAWSGANFIVGGQGGDALWDGNMAEFAPNSRALFPDDHGLYRRRAAWTWIWNCDRRERSRMDG